LDKVVYPLVAVTAWVVLVFKIVALRSDRRSVALWTMSASSLFVALSGTFSTPIVYTRLDALLGVPNLARLLSHTSIMAMGISTQAWLLYCVSPPERLRQRVLRRASLFLVAATAMTVLFVLAPVDVDTLEFSVRYGEAPFVAEYTVIFVGFFAAAMLEIGRLTWRFARVASDRFLRMGLRLATIGSGLGVAYCLEKATYVLMRRGGITLLPADVQESTGPILGGAAGLFLLVGITIPVWGRRAAHTWNLYRMFRQLRMLWVDLCAAVPGIALEDPSTTRSDLSPVDLDYRLLRRVVEIRDAWLALAQYRDAETADLARRRGMENGLNTEAVTAVIEAAVIADAMRAKERQILATSGYDVLPRGGADLAAEAQWLVRVARAYSHAPIGASVLRDRERSRDERTVNQ
jgi:hypothetical protein